MTNNHLFSAEELESYLNVSKGWIYKQTNNKNGLLKDVVRKIGRHNRYPKTEVDRVFGLGAVDNES